jgi:hypothetical protein
LGCVNPVKFDTKRSSTYASDGEAWPEKLVFATGIGVGVGSAATPFCNGIIGQDTVSIAGLTVQKQPVGLITNQSPDLFGKGSAINGIFGMAPMGAFRSGASFLKGLVDQQQIPGKMFSLYLSPKSVGNAELTIGGTNHARYSGDITYIPVDSSRGAWSIKFQSISVNGQQMVISARTAIADSGTSNMIAPRRDLNKIHALISPKIQLIDPAGAYGLPCSEIANINATISFEMGGGIFTIPSQELSVGPYARKPRTGIYRGQDGICQTLFNADSLGAPFWIIGGSLMKYYYTVWDMDKPQMGWAKTAHSPA